MPPIIPEVHPMMNAYMIVADVIFVSSVIGGTGMLGNTIGIIAWKKYGNKMPMIIPRIVPMVAIAVDSIVMSLKTSGFC